MTTIDKAKLPAHAKRGASNAYRWVTCAGSSAMENQFENVSTAFADEGTLAHALAAHCLINDTDPDGYLFMEIEEIEVLEHLDKFNQEQEKK